MDNSVAQFLNDIAIVKSGDKTPYLTHFRQKASAIVTSMEEDIKMHEHVLNTRKRKLHDIAQETVKQLSEFDKKTIENSRLEAIHKKLLKDIPIAKAHLKELQDEITVLNSQKNDLCLPEKLKDSITRLRKQKEQLTVSLAQVLRQKKELQSKYDKLVIATQKDEIELDDAEETDEDEFGDDVVKNEDLLQNVQF